jgi:mono/diheme cytochrome c family protein
MDTKDKQEYLERYRKAKEAGVPFFPDILFKDAIVVLLVFLILVALASLIGAPLEARANPADTSYTPRPEWYFLFLFQLLKYFRGELLEVVGVVVIPTLAIILLFLLPFLDRHPKRHFSSRPVVVVVTSLVILAVVFLTVQAYREAPPPAEEVAGDPTAALYAKNCAGCHGSSITVASGTNLHAIIAQGKHEGMPAWSADLTSDQIDALAGFILSPGGSKLFTENCAACHEASELVAGDPIRLKTVIEQGKDDPAHANVDIPPWNEVLGQEERTALLNFLVAPDGQRLFVTNCSPCHGRAVGFSGSEDELRELISQGGMHLDMPPWRERLSQTELETLSKYVVEPGANPDGASLFSQYCETCHGERIPRVDSVDQARQIIAEGGAHQTMPVWGQVLTPEQMDALVSYTFSTAQGTSLEVGQELFSKNCAACHGDFGEGGPNPTRPDDIIAPISSSEFLKTRDDFTLRAIIAQGQPNFGMSPFGSSFGGPLDDGEIDAIVAYLRSWESNPPVELPPEVVPAQPSLSATDIYKNLCAQCHGPNGEGGVGPSLSDPVFQSTYSDQQIFDIINQGHKATAMIGWGEVLSAEQIQQVVEFIRGLKAEETAPISTATAEAPSGPTPTGEVSASLTPTVEAGLTPTTTLGAVSFANDVLPLFEAKCKACHGSLGGWDASSYETVTTTGDNAPVVIPGDVENSLLAQKLLGTHTTGAIMPPGGKLPDAEIQVVLDWIAAGVLDN